MTRIHNQSSLPIGRTLSIHTPLVCAGDHGMSRITAEAATVSGPVVELPDSGEHDLGAVLIEGVFDAAGLAPVVATPLAG